MSSAFSRDKALPAIPIDVNVVGAVAGPEVHSPLSSTGSDGSSNMDKMLPSIDVEKTLSGEELDRLHDLWNGAALSAVSHTVPLTSEWSADGLLMTACSSAEAAWSRYDLSPSPGSDIYTGPRGCSILLTFRHSVHYDTFHHWNTEAVGLFQREETVRRTNFGQESDQRTGDTAFKGAATVDDKTQVHKVHSQSEWSGQSGCASQCRRATCVVTCKAPRP
ncbi:hypothetical protein BS17DRAFT_781361 [Gyrodon lividus]|nr:hypothetical protein BS17DRAFT_781361 [Gyrodon lividus]